MFLMLFQSLSFFFFFFNDTATTEIYTLSLHDALPISGERAEHPARRRADGEPRLDDQRGAGAGPGTDRKSTRLNSSHLVISYAVFCLKKKKKKRVLPWTITELVSIGNIDQVRSITICQ